jgi:mRNA interferase MazF
MTNWPGEQTMSTPMPKRGDIWLINLDPTVGSEIQKSRPCVVVSPAEMHDHLRTVIVAPMTSKSRAAPFRVPLIHAGTKGLILLDQIRTVDKARLIKPLGRVSAKVLGHTLQTLQEVFAL